MTLAPEALAILGGVALFLFGALVYTVRSLIVICLPNEMVVISGRRRMLEDGRDVGFRVLHGGRTLRIPVIEKVSRIDLTTIPLEVVVKNAYSKGGIPLIVRGIANVKVCAREPVAYNAVERLLDKPFDEIMQIAKDTLEGNLRGVLATLTPEEINEDRLKFAHTLIEEADEDLKKLGLELDAEARAREAEAEVSGDKARVRAQQDLQTERIVLEQKRVEADVVIPAQADRQASELRAKGVAASILENGNANLVVLDRMIQLYGKAGSDAERIFVLNMLPELVRELAGSVEHIKIDKMSVIDSGRAGTGVASAAAQFPQAIIRLTEQIETATGVNILSRLRKVPDAVVLGKGSDARK